MRIGIDARELTNKPAGKGQYVGKVIQAWAQKDSVQLILYIHAGTVLPDAYRFNGAVTVIEVKGKGIAWHVQVSRRLNSDSVTVYFAALSYLSALVNVVPTVTVVHDLAVFQRGIVHNRKSYFIEKLTLKSAVRRSAAVVSVSKSTAKDLMSYTNINSSKVTVIPIAPLSLVHTGPRVIRKERTYILFVGTLEPRKNVEVLFRAYAALPDTTREGYHLRLVGKTGWGGFDYKKLAIELGIEKTVEFCGYVNDADLPYLYSHAVVFVYPSLYEGYGVPLIEAMAAGTPVITSNNSSLPEVVGVNGITLDARDVLGFTAAIAGIISREELFEQYSLRGMLRSKEFNWERITEEILTICKKVSGIVKVDDN